MFDLHLHSNLSDGALSLSELLAYVRKKEITPFSITDHNHALAYEELDLGSYPDLILGTEITSSYKGVIVEILGYQIDPLFINQWYHSFYSQEKLIKNEMILFDRLKKLVLGLGHQLSDDLIMAEIRKGISKKTVYNDLVKNKNSLEFKSYKEFFRKGLSNPASPYFINEASTYPAFEDVIALIHKAGGIAILAHPHEYDFPDLSELYDYAIAAGIDGIESFHPSASFIQSLAIAEYCCTKNLWSSGGSDFHRYERMLALGVNISDELWAYPCYQWIRGVKSND